MKRIAVVYGGYSGEEVISRKSAAMIMKHIDATVFEATQVLINRTGWFAEVDGEHITIDKNDFSFEHAGKTHRFDKAFVIIHGTPGEDGLLQSYFDMIGLPHTTGDTLNMSLTFDKFVCNSYLRERGYATAEALMFTKGLKVDADQIVEVLALPCFVKPSRGGSSLATFKCKTKAEIVPAILKAFEVADHVVVEFIAGREFTCGVILKDGKATYLPVTEIISENDFFDFEAKYEGRSKEVTPADLSPYATLSLQKLSVEIFELLDCKGMARVDYLLQNDVPYIIEINTVPGFSEMSIVPQQANAMGISTTALITSILNG